LFDAPCFAQPDAVIKQNDGYIFAGRRPYGASETRFKRAWRLPQGQFSTFREIAALQR
jgi:hypothetical protein